MGITLMFRHSRSRTCVRGLGVVLIVVAFGCQTNPEVAKQEYLKSGDRYVADKKYFEAIVQYRNALQQDPKFGEARRKLAETYMFRVLYRLFTGRQPQRQESVGRHG